ncbi:MAG TPA: hypothetical protein VIY29_25685 [Ktedonobacteraceae bacterium]
MYELKADQLTTPIDLIMSAPEETITVVDPRHPLFGRTLPCIGIANSCHRGRCCIVWIRPTVERHVPVTATNLEYDPATLYPLPISVESLRQFLYEFACATRASEGEPADDASTTFFPSGPTGGCSRTSDPAQLGLDDAHRGATSKRAPGARHYVSGLSRAPRGGQG